MRKPRAPILVAIGGGGTLSLILVLIPAAPPASRATPPATPARVESAARAADPVSTPPRTEVPAPEPASPPSATPPPAVGKPTAFVDLGPMMFLFHRELGLTAEQRRHFQEAIDERFRAVAQVQDEVRASNFLSYSDYDAKIDAVKAVTYERMSRCLDPVQHRRFLELISDGRTGDAIVFELPPGIEIRD